MKIILIVSLGAILLCGCNQQSQHAFVSEQKAEIFPTSHDKAVLDDLLSGQTAMGWEVTASTIDPKTGDVLVFFKRTEYR